MITLETGQRDPHVVTEKWRLMWWQISKVWWQKSESSAVIEQSSMMTTQWRLAWWQNSQVWWPYNGPGVMTEYWTMVRWEQRSFSSHVNEVKVRLQLYQLLGDYWYDQLLREYYQIKIKIYLPFVNLKRKKLELFHCKESIKKIKSLSCTQSSHCLTKYRSLLSPIVSWT